MTRGDVLRWTARRLPGVDAALRDDLLATVDELAVSGRRVDRGLEIGSLVGFALRSASRNGASDNRVELIRQGVRVGALIMAMASALWSWTTVPHELATTSAATLVAIAIAGGLRTTALVLALAAVVLTALDGSPQPLALTALAAVAVGRRFDARPCPGGAAATAVGTVAAGLVAASLPTPTTTTVLVAVLSSLPVALLAVGWFDPRFAVAAMVLLGWRLLAVEVPQLVSGMGAVGHGAEGQMLVARTLLMSAGAVIAWQMSRSAIDRCLR